jgi:transposase
MQSAFDLDVEVESDVSSGLPRARKAHERSSVAFRAASEPCLDPANVSNLLPKDSPALAIRHFVRELDLSGLRQSYADNGGAPYDPGALLGVLLLSYVLGETSSVKMAELCKYDIRFMHVSGNQRPDARTIRRFRNRLNGGIASMFGEVVLRCQEAGLLSLRRVALDGTKIVSAASQLTRWLSQAEKADIAEMGFEVPESSDPEARVMKGSTKLILGYNAQAAVDCDSGIVLAIDVTNGQSDYPSLAPMAAKVIQATGIKPDELVADAGYDSSEGICACQALGLDTVIAMQQNSADFWTVIEGKEILCPMGNPVRQGRPTTVRGKKCQRYVVSGCPSCMFYRSCCPSRSHGRTLLLPVGCDPSERILAARRAQSPPGRHAMRERMATIERIFADVCSNKGFRRLRLRGLAGARLEWTLIHMARNILILAKAIFGRLMAPRRLICRFAKRQNTIQAATILVIAIMTA